MGEGSSSGHRRRAARVAAVLHPQKRRARPCPGLAVFCRPSLPRAAGGRTPKEEIASRGARREPPEVVLTRIDGGRLLVEGHRRRVRRGGHAHVKPCARVTPGQAIFFSTVIAARRAEMANIQRATLLAAARAANRPRADRPKMPLSRDPNFADAPETAQNGGFRRHFATERVFADFFLSTRRPRPKVSFAREYWLRNVAGAKYSIAPQGPFLALKRAHMGTTAYVLAR